MSEVKRYNAYAEGLTVHFELDSEGSWVTSEDFEVQRLRAVLAQEARNVKPMVLPTILSSEDGPHYSNTRTSELGYLAGYNACLDKIKELN